MDYLSTAYPAKDKTDSTVLYRSLGSFWTMVFAEKETLKGYTLGVAEELIQQYYNLVETLNSYSVIDIDILHKEKWLPLVIQKSKFNQSPFIFKDNDAVFGAQPDNDQYYAGKIFRFGFPKSPNENAFSFKPTVPLNKFSVIANRIIDPSKTYINGVDVIFDDDVLIFNKNVFKENQAMQLAIIDEFGEPSTYTDLNGNVQEDQLIILWVYHGEEDLKALYNNFGFIFGINLTSSDFYKDVLKSIFGLFVNGPNVAAINTALAAFNNIPTVIEAEEIIEQIVLGDHHKYIVTDKNVYSFESYQTVRTDLEVGDTVRVGDILIDALQYIDSITNPSWWQTEVTGDKLALSSHLFVGNYQHQLFFSTGVEIITLSSADVITFPVSGIPEDVTTFNDYLNENKEEVKAALGLSLEDNKLSKPIVPVNFLFENFFKNNTAFIKFNFHSVKEITDFFKFLPFIKTYLPSHVYLLFYINFNVDIEVMNNWNASFELADFPGTILAADGSLPDGSRPELSPSDPEYYKDFANRLFSIAIAPTRLGDPLYWPENLELIGANGLGEFYFITDTGEELITDTGDVLVTTVVSQSTIKDGEIFTYIPDNATTKTVSSILLIDFS